MDYAKDKSVDQDEKENSTLEKFIVDHFVDKKSGARHVCGFVFDWAWVHHSDAIVSVFPFRFSQQIYAVYLVSGLIVSIWNDHYKELNYLQIDGNENHHPEGNVDEPTPARLWLLVDFHLIGRLVDAVSQGHVGGGER